MSTKKIAIASKSAVFRLSLKKFLEKFNIKTYKDLNFNFDDFDLVIVDGFDVKCSNCIVIGKDIKKEEFISNDFKEELLEIINKKFGIEKEKITDYKYVLIGSSTGGPGLIEKIARALPADYKNPVCVAQHMPKGFSAKFASRLNELSKLKVVEASNTQPVIPGYFIIANSSYHLHFRKKDVVYCKLVPNIKHFFVPSVDEMFFSALEVIEPKKILAVLLTGIGDDGARGLKALKDAGAMTIAESESSAAVYGMPKAAKDIDAAIKILDFDDILKEILTW